jgi:hypothetical protein
MTFSSYVSKRITQIYQVKKFYLRLFIFDQNWLYTYTHTHTLDESPAPEPPAPECAIILDQLHFILNGNFKLNYSVYTYQTIKWLLIIIIIFS